MMKPASLQKETVELPVQVGEFQVEWILGNERWQAIRIAGFEAPLNATTVRALHRMLTLLDSYLTADPAFQAETLLQFSQLHVGGCAQLMSARASVWQPRLGLGVFPDQPPPELWNEKDFEVMPGPKMKIRPMMNTVMRCASVKAVQEEVAAECLVSGGVMRIYTPDFEAFLRKSKEFLLPRLRGSVFQGHRFYLPILNSRSLAGAPDDLLDTWLPGAVGYVAQCPDEQALVLALRGNLPRLLHRVHAEIEGQRAIAG